MKGKFNPQNSGFEMLPKPALVLRYIAHYGKPYKGPHNYVATYRVKGRHSHEAEKMLTGVAHRGEHAVSDAFDERDRLFKIVGTRDEQGRCYGNRIYGHGKCMKYGTEHIFLDDPNLDNFVCAWCNKPLVPKEEEKQS